ncbi:MAG: hypothetical protein IKW67_02155 [Alphaproteobacteria bacterium]|nr:hypothetical protein [Alphaproteobacteria bacterium]
MTLEQQIKFLEEALREYNQKMDDLVRRMRYCEVYMAENHSNRKIYGQAGRCIGDMNRDLIALRKLTRDTYDRLNMLYEIQRQR